VSVSTQLANMMLPWYRFANRPLSTTANVIYPTRHMRAVGERSREGPEEIMPAPPEGVRNECIRSLQVLMRFMSKAWHLDLDEVVCEFVCDSDHKMWMVRVVRYGIISCCSGVACVSAGG